MIFFKKNLIIATSIMALLLSFHNIHAQLDSEGWTILDPSRTEKVIYISASEGNDATGVAYDYPNATIGGDPQSPDGTIMPFATLEEAHNQIQPGETAWILFKRGDVFFYNVTPRGAPLNNDPMVYSYYGDAGNQPLFKVGSEAGLIACCNDNQNFWVIGLSFYAHTRNPTDPDYVGVEGNNGILFFVSEGRTFRDVLIEGCSFSYFIFNTIQGIDVTGENGMQNITLRRNSFFDSYAYDSNSSGLFVGEAREISLVENIFDHNGWLIQSVNGDNDPSGGQAQIFNHNTYFGGVDDVDFTGNLFLRASSLGTKWISPGQGMVNNIDIIDNLYYAGEVGISMGGNDTADPFRFQGVQVRDNIFDNIGTERPTNRDLGWGILINDWDNGVVTGNIITNFNDPNVNNVFGIRLRGENRNVVVENNTIYDLDYGNGFVFEANLIENVMIRNNDLQFEVFPDRFFIQNFSGPLPNFETNTYFNPDANQGDDFRVSTINMDFATWSQDYGDVNSQINELVYVDPTRSLERYATEVLNLNSLNDFFDELRNESRLNWRTEYSASTINQWIREGFQEQTLPVEWLSFRAAIAGRTVQLNWEISREIDNAGFQAERSADGRNWSVIGRVAPHLSADQTYEYTDLNPLKITGFYRIRQTDFDGSVTYSPVRSINFNHPEELTVYPNPVTGTVIAELPAGTQLVDVLNARGQSVRVHFAGAAGQLRANLEGLPQGVYMLRARAADGRLLTKRLVKR